MTFNPKQHLTKVKGKDYLEVKWRLVWFRDEHPDYTIDTEFPVLDMDQGVAVCQAIIKDDEGRQLAKGTKTEYKANFFDFVEKSETGAIGRALAALGYGTQFAPELEEGDRIVDSPVKKPKKKSKSKTADKIREKCNGHKDLIAKVQDWLEDAGVKKLEQLANEEQGILLEEIENMKDKSEDIAEKAVENIE